MFKCKACAAKDQHISDLKKEIETLKAVAYPHLMSNSAAFMRSLEANKVLGGELDQINLEVHTEDHISDFNSNWN